MRTHRGTAASTGQTLLGKTKDSDLLASDLLLVQRQDVILVLQQDDALCTGFTDERLVLGLVDSLLWRNGRIVKALLTL